MRKLLMVTAAAEAATGLALLLRPSVVIRLLFGANLPPDGVDDLAATGIMVGRVTGIALIALGIACWPDRDPSGRSTFALCGMLVYSALVTMYLGYVGFGGEWVGKLLWPAVVLHGVLTFLLARQWFMKWKPPAIHRDEN